jgi:hypothetical protein
MAWIKIWGSMPASAVTTCEAAQWDGLYNNISEKSGDVVETRREPGEWEWGSSRVGWRWFDQMAHPTEIWRGRAIRGQEEQLLMDALQGLSLGRLSKPSASGQLLQRPVALPEVRSHLAHWHPARPGRCLHVSRGRLACTFPFSDGPVLRRGAGDMSN